MQANVWQNELIQLGRWIWNLKQIREIVYQLGREGDGIGRLINYSRTQPGLYRGTGTGRGRVLYFKLVDGKG